MEIISAPHPTLRQKAKLVDKFDKKFFKFIDQLIHTLVTKEEPQGVGLAAPQVNKSLQVFVAIIGDNKEAEVFINPQISKYSKKQILGLKNGQERFEGCLSVPALYGPVPRFEWIELQYQTIKKNAAGKQEIVEKKARFNDFDARVLQHEYDHLNGILFTDHILEKKLPIYVIENEHWVEVEDRRILETF